MSKIALVGPANNSIVAHALHLYCNIESCPAAMSKMYRLAYETLRRLKWGV